MYYAHYLFSYTLINKNLLHNNNYYIILQRANNTIYYTHSIEKHNNESKFYLIAR